MAQQLYNTVMMLILSNIAMFWNLSSVCQEFCLILRRLYLNEHASVAASKYKIHSAENKKKRKLNSNNYIQFYIAATEKTWF